jgi:hypothetical protein
MYLCRRRVLSVEALRDREVWGGVHFRESNNLALVDALKCRVSGRLRWPLFGLRIMEFIDDMKHQSDVSKTGHQRRRRGLKDEVDVGKFVIRYGPPWVSICTFAQPYMTQLQSWHQERILYICPSHHPAVSSIVFSSRHALRKKRIFSHVHHTISLL